MALATTTNSAAIAQGDKTIAVASATSVAAGRFIVVGGEMMQVTKGYVTASTTVPVLRGVGGTAQVAHAVTSNVLHGAAADFGDPGAGVSVNFPPAGRARVVSTYGAAGAIALPSAGTDSVAIINGTAALAMTLAVPTNEMDGCILYIIGNGKAAHTVTAASGFGLAGSSYDVATFNANGNCGILCIAVNGAWILLSSMTGTLTNFVPAIA